MKKLVLSILASAALLSGCATDFNTIPPLAPAQAQVNPPSTTTQVEFLARPGIAEGLLFSNELLNAYNSLRPRDVAAALPAPTGTAADIFTEATAVLDALEAADGNNSNAPTTATLVGIFLPDVMRIDTTNNFNLADVAYNGSANTNGVLTGGRKITDDVIDITLDVLSDGFVTSDGVPYYRPAAGPGSTNQAIGHSRLNGQTVDFGASQFPFLADPN